MQRQLPDRMSLNRRIALGVLTSYVARALQILLTLALLPLMFRRLSHEVVGMWYLLSQATLFLGLLDFGFGPTLTRRLAFATGLSGANVDAELTPASRQKLGNLIYTGRVVYRWLAMVVFLVAASAGSLCLRRLKLEDLTDQQVMGAWLLFSLSYAINAWGGLWVALLGGLGYVGTANLITVVTQVLGGLGKLAVVVLGGGLLSLAVVDCITFVVARQVGRAYLMWKEPTVLAQTGKWSADDFWSMLNPALKCWATSLGAFLVLKTDELFIAFYFGPADIADYRAAYSVISYIYTLALTFSYVSMPFYSHLWQSQNLPLLHSVLLRNLAVGLGIMVAGLAAVLFSSPGLFNIWIGPDNFIGFPILLVFSAMLCLDAQHVIFTCASRSTEDEVFALWALGAGVLNLLLTWILLHPLGLLGIALGTLLAQICTNNWYCVYRGTQRLQLPLATYAKRILAPLAGLAVAIALPLAFAVQYVPPISSPWREWLTLTVVCAWSGGALLIFLWRVAFNSEERMRLVMQVRAILSTSWLRSILVR
jgi:O-antigen/teichoic acid export membrane protein